MLSSSELLELLCTPAWGWSKSEKQESDRCSCSGALRCLFVPVLLTRAAFARCQHIPALQQGKWLPVELVQVAALEWKILSRSLEAAISGYDLENTLFRHWLKINYILIP